MELRLKKISLGGNENSNEWCHTSMVTVDRIVRVVKEIWIPHLKYIIYIWRSIVQKGHLAIQKTNALSQFLPPPFPLKNITLQVPQF